MKRFLLLGALLGTPIPIGFLVAHEFQPWPRSFRAAEPWSIGFFETPLWPSVIQLMAVQGETWSASNVAVFAVSFGLNALLYSAVGALLWAGIAKWRPILWCSSQAITSLWWLVNPL